MPLDSQTGLKKKRKKRKKGFTQLKALSKTMVTEALWTHILDLDFRESKLPWLDIVLLSYDE